MSDLEEDPEVLVVDNGTYMCKAGFAGDKTCRSVQYNMTTPTSKDFVAGSREQQEILYPMERGIIVNWEAMEEVWQQTLYDGLRISPEEHPVLMTEAPLNPKSHVEKMAQVMFEAFSVPAFGVAIPAVLSLILSGRLTGTCCDVGEGLTHIIHMVEGYIMDDIIVRQDFAGRDVTDLLQTVLAKHGYTFASDSERQMVRKMKEQICRCWPCSSDDTRVFEEGVPYKFDNGQTIVIKEDMYRCAGALFRPSEYFTDCTFKGLQNLIVESISKASIDIRGELLKSIVMSGSSTMHKGFQKRMEYEMRELLPNSENFHIICPPERNKSAWLGGSIIGGLDSFQTDRYLATSKEYQEYGPSIMHRKCSYKS